MNTRVFVTGGSGFVGQRLVRLLVAKGYTVRALARSESAEQILESLGTEVVRGDLFSYESLERGASDCHAVVHLAGSPSFRLIDRRKMMSVHTEGTRNVITLIERKNIEKFLYCSSIGALAIPSTGQNTNRKEYRSAYEQAKFMAHSEVAMLAKRREGIITAIPAYVMGPGGKDILGAYMKAFCQGRLPFVIRLEQPMSYVHVDDVAEGLYLCLTKGHSGGQYILASEACTPLQLIELMEKYSQKTRPSMTLSPSLATPLLLLDEILASVTGRHPHMTVELLHILKSRPWVFVADRTKEELGWKPRNLEQMVRETVASFN